MAISWAKIVPNTTEISSILRPVIVWNPNIPETFTIHELANMRPNRQGGQVAHSSLKRPWNLGTEWPLRDAPSHRSANPLVSP